MMSRVNVSTSMKLQFGAAVAALLLVSFMIMRVSSAAFSASTQTTDTWSSASVALTDDDGSGIATFTSSTSMVPGDTEQACITVTYGGDVAAAVKLYGSTTTAAGDLGQYLDLTIDEVSGIDGTDGSCADPGGTLDVETVTTIYNGTLSVNAGAFTVAHTDWSNGLASSWAPSVSGETQI